MAKFHLVIIAIAALSLTACGGTAPNFVHGGGGGGGSSHQVNPFGGLQDSNPDGNVGGLVSGGEVNVAPAETVVASPEPSAPPTVASQPAAPAQTGADGDSSDGTFGAASS